MTQRQWRKRICTIAFDFHYSFLLSSLLPKTTRLKLELHDIARGAGTCHLPSSYISSTGSFQFPIATRNKASLFFFPASSSIRKFKALEVNINPSTRSIITGADRQAGRLSTLPASRNPLLYSSQFSETPGAVAGSHHLGRRRALSYIIVSPCCPASTVSPQKRIATGARERCSCIIT